MLPRETQYSVSALPECSTSSYVSRAVNGSTFSSGQIQTNLIQNRDCYLIPSSMYAQFTISVDAAAADTNVLLGLPSASIFERSDVFLNSSNVDSISNYGGVVNMLYNGKIDIAGKMGLSKALGNEFVENAANEVDSRTIAAASGTNTFSVAIPLCNILSLQEKLYPLSAGEARIYLTISDILNWSCKNDGTASTLSNLQISSFEIHYKAITFDGPTSSLIMSQVQPDGNVYLKSESYQSSVANLPTGSSGSVGLVYANSLTSIKSLFTQFCRADRFKVNCGAAYDPQFSTFNYEIAGRPLPSTPYTSQGVAGITLEALEAFNGVMSHAQGASTSMSANNWRELNDAFGADSFKDLPKAYFCYNCEKLPSSTALNGISSQNSNIVVRLNIGTATISTATVLQIFQHDCILKVGQDGSLTVMR